MSFEFNENGCRVVKNFFNDKIQGLEKEIKEVKALMEPEKDPQVRAAFLSYICGVEKRISECRCKVAEMDDYLNSDPSGAS